MAKETERTYTPWQKFPQKSKQTEYTEPVKMLDDDGNLLVKGWARKNVFDYDRTKVKPQMRGKEWDFYQLSDGKMMVQISFANISMGGYASAAIIDLKNGKLIKNQTALFLGGKNKYVLPPKGDVPNVVDISVGGARFFIDTKENTRTLYFKMKNVECNFEMDIFDNHENITTVLPFEGEPTRFFMTTKQNCMPCSGTYKLGDKVYEFSKDDTFCSLDWGRVNTKHRLVWYWGNGST
ncbi:MAG: DUF2804 domain-containing protein, partial [Clostridiales bacterium]|nr:DUF2804 domain-containing protein [Clostridiales bacterium]